jgi:hypothetical protein
MNNRRAAIIRSVAPSLLPSFSNNGGPALASSLVPPYIALSSPDLPPLVIMKRLILILIVMNLSLPLRASDKDFDQLAKEYIEAFPALHPVSATQLGDHRFDADVDDVSEAVSTTTGRGIATKSASPGVPSVAGVPATELRCAENEPADAGFDRPIRSAVMGTPSLMSH